MLRFLKSPKFLNGYSFSAKVYTNDLDSERTGEGKKMRHIPHVFDEGLLVFLLLTIKGI